MSTDVLRWTDGHREYEPEALSTYFAISISLMVLTFSAWIVVAKFEERKSSIDAFLRKFKQTVPV